MNFATIPAWSVQPKPGKLSFYETIALAGLEDKAIRLSAADQRALLGSVIFGKREIFVDSKTGVVRVYRKTCFGMDCEAADYSPERIGAAIDDRKQLSPGVFGPGFI